MFLKAFDYTMMMDVVLRDEMFFMQLLRGNYAFESPSLYDDGGYCVSLEGGEYNQLVPSCDAAQRIYDTIQHELQDNFSFI